MLIILHSNTGNLYSPELMEGRWLQTGDLSAIVVSFEFLTGEPYALGDSVTFQFGNATQQMTIVGTVKEIGSQSIYMERAGFERLIPAEAQRSSVPIATAQKTPEP